ncbi:MAG: undecaprenyl-diphosphate phosphatase [Polyangiaceae bacterium]
MSWLEAALLGVLEGLTELLPVSSTGHLVLLGEWLGGHDDAAKSFDIVIQLGAVLAVALYYRARLGALAGGVVRRDPRALQLLAALAVGFLPAALVGLALHRWIKERLFGAVPVAAALIVGGVLMIGVEVGRRWYARRAARTDSDTDTDTDRRGSSTTTTTASAPGLVGLEHVTIWRALVIGLSQCLSLWPGTSRSMTTIVGGQLSGLSTATAAEFSFLLAIPTLGAATLYDLYKNGHALLAAPQGATALAIGMVTSFAVALLVVHAFLRYLRRFGMVPFGVYRIALGALVLLLVRPG